MENTFSKNLRTARKVHGWTRKQSASFIGVKLPTFGSYEEGRAYPPITVFAQICHVFSITDVIGFIEKENFDITDQDIKNIPPAILEDRYNNLTGPAKKAVNVLLGIE